jgi:TonB family protein
MLVARSVANPFILLLILLLFVTSACSDGPPTEAEAAHTFAQHYPEAKLLAARITEDEVIARSFAFRYQTKDGAIGELEIQFMRDRSGTWVPTPAAPSSLSVSSARPSASMASPQRGTATARTAVSCFGQPRAVSNDILLPTVLNRVRPDYSRCGGRGIDNPVLEARITTAGKATAVRVITPAGDCLNAAALEAIRQWTFCPAERNGEPIETTMQFTVDVNYK